MRVSLNLAIVPDAEKFGVGVLNTEDGPQTMGVEVRSHAGAGFAFTQEDLGRSHELGHIPESNI